MGDEVSQRFFEAEDFSRFRDRLDEETGLLEQLFDSDGFSTRGDIAGFELEAWLVDKHGNPSADNQRFLDALRSPLVVPELAKFNVELNGSPTALTGRVFARLHDELAATWDRCLGVAEDLGDRLVTIGTLPSAPSDAFVADNMSGMVRYQSVNDRIMALRDGRDIHIQIEGDESLDLYHDDVMLEAAATSFQIHLQCRPNRAVRDFNASLIAAAPLVAASANSPFLFGRSLWDESRIPLFEQAVDVGRLYPPRVSFGRGYVQDSLFEIFQENQLDHLILIPWVRDTPSNQFAHLRFQNGTLWRWVRPLIGFDFDGQVHLRIEQRVASAGPTLKDSIANSAFYFGLVRGLGLSEEAPEKTLSFPDCRQNFYMAAKHGLNAEVLWPDGGSLKQINMRSLVVDELVPLARLGLASAGIPDIDLDEYLGIIAARADSGQNGAAWQRAWLSQHKGSMAELTLAYCDRQESFKPVHEWSL